jgi:hypothetical protein
MKIISVTGVTSKETIFVVAENILIFSKFAYLSDNGTSLEGSIIRVVDGTTVNVRENPRDIYNKIHPKTFNTGPG